MFNTKFLLKPQIPHSIGLADALSEKEVGADWSPTGTGKTYTAAAIMRALKCKFVIIGPKLSLPKWLKVCAQFGVKPMLAINYEKLARGNTPYYKYHERGVSPSGTKWNEVPWFLRGKFTFPKDVVIIFDESHRTKGMESLNAGLPYAAKMQGFTVMPISATQAMVPMDMRAFGFLMGLHKGMHTKGGRFENWGMNIFKEFCVEAGAEFTGSFGAMFFDSDKPESVEKLQAIRAKMVDEWKIAYRMNRADFGDIFPHNQIESEAYDMGENGKKIAAAYDEMEEEMLRLEEDSKRYKEHIFAILMKLRRTTEMLKVPTMVEMALDLYRENFSVLIFVNFTETIEAINKKLIHELGQDKKDLIGFIYGEQSTNERLRDIDAFQSDKKRFMVANVAAGGESIDLQDITGKHPRGNLINPSYRAPLVIQAMGRHDRAYAKSDVLTRLVLAAGTVEDSVGYKFNQKKNHLDILNDGDLIPDGRLFKLMKEKLGNMMT